MVNFIRPGVLNEYAFFKHFFEVHILRSSSVAFHVLTG